MVDVFITSGNKSEAFRAYFVFVLQRNSTSISLCEGSFLSHNALSHIMTMQQEDL